MNDKVKVAIASDASMIREAQGGENMNAQGVYTFECRDADGNLKWSETISNLVTTVGKNDMLDKYLSGSAYTAAFYMGLISSVTYTAIAAGDTMASHTGWTEAGVANAPTYSNSARPTAAWAAAASGAKQLSSSLTFNITSAGTLKGSFLTTNATKDGTLGILFSAGTFSGGDKVVANGDSVSVSYSLTV